jgi:molecular chaperone DnaK (HSP70)
MPSVMATPDKDADRIIGIDLGMTSLITAYVPGPGQAPKVIPAEKEPADAWRRWWP